MKLHDSADSHCGSGTCTDGELPCDSSVIELHLGCLSGSYPVVPLERASLIMGVVRKKKKISLTSLGMGRENFLGMDAMV